MYLLAEYTGFHLFFTPLDPVEIKLPLLDQPYHFYANPENDAPEIIRAMNRTFREADAFLIVSAEYNTTVPPALANILDYFPATAFSFRPAGIVVYTRSKYNSILQRLLAHLIL